MPLNVIILAAGQGTRMLSSTPKVMHHLAGKPLLQHVIDKAQSLNPDKIIVVVGHKANEIKDQITNEKITWVDQKEQLGTAHAVEQCLPHLDGKSKTLILYGDVPLIEYSTLIHFLEMVSEKQLGVITISVEDPTGYGRIVRDEELNILSIVEEKDATEQIKKIKEVNTGLYCVPGSYLHQFIQDIDNNNAQNEYYLTDIVALAKKQKLDVVSVQPNQSYEVQGVNSRAQLALLERQYQKHLAANYMENGVSFADPERVDFRGHVEFKTDVLVDINTIFEGEVIVGHNVSIGANCIIKDSIIGDNVEIKANTMLDKAIVRSEAIVGPFARLRPGTEVEEMARVGNFVETKNSTIGQASKVNHLSYIGDASIGPEVNIGAGTITCNYDGVNKHRTDIKGGAFIGSNTSLVAPVTVGESATIAAGSVITKSADDDALTISRAKQRVISGWKRPLKK